jgi:Trp operon repressor
MSTVDTQEVFNFGKKFFENKLTELMFTEDLINLLLNIILIPDNQQAMIKKAEIYLKECGFLNENGMPTEQAIALYATNQFKEVK